MGADTFVLQKSDVEGKMANTDFVERILVNLKKWVDEEQIPEKGVECFLWIELFQSALGWVKKERNYTLMCGD
ncbi:MAG TPA: hypothetical protein ENN07_03925 [candidate division Zixibacteria bacterium]|nr:hypothetical protein [candidate division Zixibacteria bacterium]